MPKFLASLLFLCSVCAHAVSAIDSEINPQNGHTYYLLSESSWQDAEAAAAGLGGHLVTIDDANEQSWVFERFGTVGGTSRALWIGLHRLSTSDAFRWIDGTVVGYTNWLPGQPDSNLLGPELYVQMVGSRNGFGVTPGAWNDIASPNVYYPQLGPIAGVVEVATPVPEPETWAMWAAGLALASALAATRKRRS